HLSVAGFFREPGPYDFNRFRPAVTSTPDAATRSAHDTGEQHMLKRMTVGITVAACLAAAWGVQVRAQAPAQAPAQGRGRAVGATTGNGPGYPTDEQYTNSKEAQADM